MSFSADWCPKFSYGSPPTTVTLTCPMQPPRPATWTTGAGRREAANGLPSVWPGTRFHGTRLTLVGTEDEWDDVRALLVWAADSGSSFTFWPDAATAGTSYTVYLIAPVVTDRIEPNWTGGGFWTFEIEVRQTTGAAIDVAYHG